MSPSRESAFQDPCSDCGMGEIVFVCFGPSAITPDAARICREDMFERYMDLLNGWPPRDLGTYLNLRQAESA